MKSKKKDQLNYQNVANHLIGNNFISIFCLIFVNYFYFLTFNNKRDHIRLGGLCGRTPADAAKIKVERLNKWQTLIENASLHTYE